jgi:hypothetical protein
MERVKKKISERVNERVRVLQRSILMRQGLVETEEGAGTK